MKRFYSPSTQNTYLAGINTEVMPTDAIEISEARYLEVIANPVLGKVRAHDEKGLPYLVDAPVVVPDSGVIERAWRDAELSSVIWLRDRHRDQLDIGSDTTLTVEQFAELLLYMQALRDWPQSPDFPDSEHRPVAPAWIADQTE
jgi:hypothetical protein